jgi:RNase P/RNase MRP subunit POP5
MFEDSSRRILHPGTSSNTTVLSPERTRVPATASAIVCMHPESQRRLSVLVEEWSGAVRPKDEERIIPCAQELMHRITADVALVEMIVAAHPDPAVF